VGHGVWTFQITLTTKSGQVLWEPLVTLAAELGDLAGPTRRHLRLALASEHPAIVEALDRARRDAVHALIHSIRRPAEIWTLREQRIMAALQSQHARLSATLGQRLLFGGERNRPAAPQAMLLEAALSQCAERLRALKALDDVEVEAVRLAFAAVVL
jgi:hypothetical protein